MSVQTTGGGGYTHAAWKQETGQVLLVTAAAVRALTEMEASQAAVGGGQTLLARIRGCIVTGSENLTHGLDLVDATDRRYLPVAEAVRAAGGRAEVADAKTYHQA